MFRPSPADAASMALMRDLLFLSRDTGKMDKVTSKEKKELGYDIPILG